MKTLPETMMDAALPTETTCGQPSREDDVAGAISPDSIVERWFRRHAKELGKFLRSHLSNDQDVDECMQETMLKAWRVEQRGKLQEETPGFLFSTALNVVRDHRRRAKSRHENAHEDLPEAGLEVGTPGVESFAYWKQGVHELQDSLKDLRPSTRSIFLLYHVENLSYLDIANRLGITTRTVEREMARALAHCSSRVRPYLSGR